MNTKASLASFIYHGQIAQSACEKSTGTNKQESEFGYEVILKKVSALQLDEDIVGAAKKMSAVYIAIAAFENSFREIISEKLLEKHGEKWWDSNAISNEIRKKADQKKQDERNSRWHGQRGISPLAFTELKDLVAIVANNWADFEPLFGDQDWIRQNVRSIERSRNVIMHSGQLAIEDIERIGIIIRDWIRQVGA